MTRMLLTLICVVSAIASLSPAQTVVGTPARGAGANPGQAVRRLTEQQVREANDWVTHNMPNLAALASEPRRPRMVQIAWNHYQNYLKVAGTNPNAANRLLATFQAEDELYGYLRELDKAAPQERPAIKEKIRIGARKILESNFQERAARIEKLKKDIADQEQQLAQDQRDLDNIVARQLLNRFGIDVQSAAPTTSPTARPDAETGVAGQNTLADPNP